MRKNPGFTLIELVIVIAIIGILASLAVPKFIDMSTESKIATTKAGLGALRGVLATRYAASATGGATASYPTALDALDFANKELPRNRLDSFVDVAGILAWTETIPGTQAPMSMKAFWYVSDPASANYGKAGAFSNYASQYDTSDW